MAKWQLDGKEVIKVDMIDGEAYVCTNDLVRMDPDGRITYLGRANRFFMRDDGRKFESGRVETEFNRLEDINGCAIVPVYYKIEHDTIPMLCVQPVDGSGDAKDVILNALRQVFIDEKTLSEDNIPARVLLTESLPRNTNGKIDLYKLNQGKVSGDIYIVNAIREEDQLTDFSLAPFEDDSTSDVVEMVIGSITADMKSSGSNSVLMQGIEKMSDSKEADSSVLALDMEKLSDPKALISTLTSSMPTLPPMPFMPFMPTMPGAEDGDGQTAKEQWEDFKSKADSLWEKQRKLQKSSMIAASEWWSSFFI